MSQPQKTLESQPFLSSLMPLDVDRRDRAMNLFARRSRKSLTQYDICKLHVMSDVFHVLENGTPLFGGLLSAWEYGPVVTETFFCAKNWATSLAFALSVGIPPAKQPLHVAGTNDSGNVFYFAPSPEWNTSESDFSPAANRAMQAAENLVLVRLANFKKSQDYFHGVTPSAVGNAWKIARDAERELINWFDIFDAAERVEHRNVDLARANAELWI